MTETHDSKYFARFLRKCSQRKYSNSAALPRKVFPTIFQNNYRLIADKLNTFQIELLIDDIINKELLNGTQIKIKTTKGKKQEKR